MLKDYLKKKGIKFQDIDVSADHQAAEDMIEKSGQMGVPQIEIGDAIIVGFNKPAIDKELEKIKAA